MGVIPRPYFDQNIWLIVISLFSIVDIASVLIYKKNIFDTYQTFIYNFPLLTIIALIFYTGWKILPSVLRFILLLLEAILFEIGWDKSNLDRNHIWRQSNEKILNAKKFALENHNSLILNILLNADKNAKKREYTAQLYVWNYILFIIIFLFSLSIDDKTTNLPFYFEVYQYALNIDLIMQNTLLLNTIKWLFIIAVIGMIIKTLSEVWLYLKYDDFIFISFEDMRIIDEIIEDAKP